MKSLRKFKIKYKGAILPNEIKEIPVDAHFYEFEGSNIIFYVEIGPTIERPNSLTHNCKVAEFQCPFIIEAYEIDASGNKLKNLL